MSYPRRPKPPELTALHDLAGDLFELFRETFDMPGVYELPLHDVDGNHAPAHDDEQVVAALAMHDTQTLRRAAAAGQPVTNVELVSVAAALHRAIDALVARPSGHDVASLLCEARDRINHAARVAAALGRGVDGGIVELR